MNAQISITRSRSGAPQLPVSEALDSELVGRALAGDRDASNELLERHKSAAYRLALQLLGDPDEAFDIVQDALLRMTTSLDRFDAKRPVRPWLLSIVRNRVIDVVRQRQRRPALSLDQWLEDGLAEPITQELDALETLERRDLQRLIASALSTLPHAQREILVLRDYQDLSYGEIAETLSIPLGTVMSQLRRDR